MKRTPNATPTLVYSIIDRNGVVIYVGQTLNLMVRMSEHARLSAWATDAHIVQASEYPTRKMALIVERQMIKRYRATLRNDLLLGAGTTTSAAWIEHALIERFECDDASALLDALVARCALPIRDRVFYTR